jgi:hypothetical protein
VIPCPGTVRDVAKRYTVIAPGKEKCERLPVVRMNLRRNQIENLQRITWHMPKRSKKWNIVSRRRVEVGRKTASGMQAEQQENFRGRENDRQTVQYSRIYP